MRYLIKNKYWKINREYNIDKLLYLLVDRSDVIGEFWKELIWTNNKNQTHRNYDLPSYFTSFETVKWKVNNKMHRNYSKPAFIDIHGAKQYWLYGKLME